MFLFSWVYYGGNLGGWQWRGVVREEFHAEARRHKGRKEEKVSIFAKAIKDFLRQWVPVIVHGLFARKIFIIEKITAEIELTNNSDY